MELKDDKINKEKLFSTFLTCNNTKHLQNIDLNGQRNAQNWYSYSICIVSFRNGFFYSMEKILGSESLN